MLPDSARRVITPADALNLAYDAHHMVQAYTRRTPLGRRIELRCSCQSVISRPTEDATFDAWHRHLGDCTDTFVASLVDPMWLATMMAALTPDDDRLDSLGRQLAAHASLGDVTPLADDERRVRRCGCPTRFGRHAMGCEATR